MDWWLLLVGVAAGTLSGLFGIGGGLVMTPVLHYVVGRSWGESVSLSLFAIAIQTPVGISRHARKGAVVPRLAVPMAVGGLAGVGVGIWLIERIAVPWLKLTFALVMGWAAWRMVARQPTAHGHGAGAVAGTVLGFAAGVLSRLLGIGGGLLTVPALVLLGARVHPAIGSSLVPVFTNAAFATAVSLATGLAWKGGVLLALGAMAGAWWGVHLAHRAPEAILRRWFAVALGLAAAYVALTSGI